MINNDIGPGRALWDVEQARGNIDARRGCAIQRSLREMLKRPLIGNKEIRMAQAQTEDCRVRCT